MNGTKTALRDEVEKLAERAFHLKLISGYGDGQELDEYQIVWQGKPRHFSLEYARYLLRQVLKNRPESPALRQPC